MMEAYLGALLARGAYDHFFSDDVVFSLEGGQRAEGRAVKQAIDYARGCLRRSLPRSALIAGSDKAALEANRRYAAEFTALPPAVVRYACLAASSTTWPDHPPHLSGDERWSAS
jgi:hypothetical protein